jgi:hypothetical protein
MINIGFSDKAGGTAWNDRLPIVPSPGDIVYTHTGRPYIVTDAPREFDKGFIIIRVVERPKGYRW